MTAELILFGALIVSVAVLTWHFIDYAGKYPRYKDDLEKSYSWLAITVVLLILLIAMMANS